MSHSEYLEPLQDWYETVGSDWRGLREEAMTLLKEEEKMIACYTDGIRPVIFKIQKIPE